MFNHSRLTLARTPQLLDLRSVVLCSLVWLSMLTSVKGQGTWEYSPYRVQAWVVVEASPFLPPRSEERLSEAIVSGAWSVAEYGWQVTADAAPLGLDLTRQLSAVSGGTRGTAHGRKSPATIR